jgi:hypothetical protein
MDFSGSQKLNDLFGARVARQHRVYVWKISVVLIASLGTATHPDGIPHVMQDLVDAVIQLELVGRKSLTHITA